MAHGDSPAICRSFHRDVERPLALLEHVSLETLCALDCGSHRYPLLLAKCGSTSPNSPLILISAGLHGDEAAGVYAAVNFLERIAPSFADDFEFCVLPCVNPSGFEANTLESMNGANLNRLFGTDSDQPEIAAIEDWLAQESPRFRLTFDLHEIPPHYRGEGFVESDNPGACYLYETCHETGSRIGRQLIDALPDSVEVCRWPKIYLDANDAGVVEYPEACANPVYGQGTTFDAFLSAQYTPHAFTTETPTLWPLEKRVDVQLTWLTTALELVPDR